ncbi:cation:proton antiporter [Croceicoccus marinus]|jgi:CPA2 family monovalent cation:H+ antiporter-2/glutathione-regulated potassium-efflux system protein KefB|uniref:Cation:proton antiporter n=1 Tax=Croceicoccus marinus TaxID=450378 RepID=A0A7G6VWY9_9SPHN|nr:cation:proton antiporter [Croceicoccus marinus]QNE06254.1 cation:proton antiporter [Croceicoccus marinus]
MEEGGSAGLLVEGFVLLGFALGFVLLFRRLGLGATLGYLVAGVMVGPQVLGLAGDAEDKLHFAELGITFLLFIVGLELAPQRLWRMRREIFGLGFAQVLLCAVAIVAIIYLTTGFTFAAVLALGLPLALSSTAQVLPMLQSAGRLRTPFGERAFAVLLFQDLSIIPLLTIVAALSRNPADQAGPPGWQLGLMTIAAVGGLVLAGAYLLRPLLRLIGNLGEREMFVVAGLFAVVGSAALMAWLGLSTALGAFVAGVMLASSPFRHELEADVEPFRSILLGLFFLAVGMILDLQAIADRPIFVLLGAVLLISAKAGVIFLLGLLAKMQWRSALALGLLLSQGGEFGFVLFAAAERGLLISSEASSLFTAIVTISMACTPFLMKFTSSIRRPPGTPGEEREGPVNKGATALVVGYGRFGQTVAQTLAAGEIGLTVIDSNVEQIDVAREFGATVYFGDGTRMDMLRQAGAAEAEAILFCIDGDQIDANLLREVHEAFPSALVHIRVYDRRSIIELDPGKNDVVVREVFESAIAMAREALRGLGSSEQLIENAIDDYRKADEDRLDLQREAGDLRAGIDRMFVPDPRH